MIGIVISVPTGIIVRKSLQKAWTRSRGMQPPKKPKSPETDWLEAIAWADRIAEANPAGAASDRSPERAISGTSRNVDLDQDEDQLAAYNEYLAHINSHQPGPVRE